MMKSFGALVAKRILLFLVFFMFVMFNTLGENINIPVAVVVICYHFLKLQMTQHALAFGSVEPAIIEEGKKILALESVFTMLYIALCVFRIIIIGI